MSPANIAIAAAEARRFLDRVKTWKEAQGTYVGYNGDDYPVSTPKQDGALRRASMDLTRSLASMRRPA